MPDESCRMCGGELISHSLCSGCREVIQQICKMCGSRTFDRIHDRCLPIEPIATQNGMRTEIVMLPNVAIRIKKSHTLRNALLAIGIICSFVLGVAVAAQLDTLIIPQSEAESAKPIVNLKEPLNGTQRLARATHENCLAGGEEESVTLKCPTKEGKVYTAVVIMPSDLADKFSKESFSIRGVTVTENVDGSLFLKYHNEIYLTRFIGQ
ncbi:MAG: hypothetical protein ACT4N5_07240 [Nitrosopumilaceae archaeon]